MRPVLSILFLTLPITAGAGEWHIGESLLCQDCHLQHSSEQGEPVAGGPYSVLLLKSSINELCLSCHDGSTPTAPDVQSPVQMYESTTSGESAAGWFGLLGADNQAGHNIGIPTLTPLQTETNLVDLSCAHCHAVHGNSNYRNLRFDPAEQGDSIVLVDGVDLYSLFKPADPPAAAATIAAYERNNIGYKQNYADWCLTCHDQAQADASGIPPAHFNGHPSDVALNAYSTGSHTDPPHWIAGTGEGFSAGGTTGALSIERVPVEASSANSYLAAREPTAANEVTCISCHRPHGGQYQKALRWPYREGGDSFLAGCQQCHNK